MCSGPPSSVCACAPKPTAAKASMAAMREVNRENMGSFRSMLMDPVSPKPETPRNRLCRAAGVAPGKGVSEPHEVGEAGGELVIRLEVDGLHDHGPAGGVFAHCLQKRVRVV